MRFGEPVHPDARQLAAFNVMLADKRARAAASKVRRDERRARGVCINGCEQPIFRGGRCPLCWTKKVDAEAKRRRLRAIAR